MRVKNKQRRYRIDSGTALKLGLTINKTNRYRLSPEQEKDLFNLDQHDIKRLFFDIETTPYITYTFNVGYKVKNIPYEFIIEHQKIICISYVFGEDDKIKRLTWDENQCDKKMIEEFISIMNQADEIVAHNGDRYDMKKLKTRAIYHRLPMMPKYRTLDTLLKSRKDFSFPSNRLDDIANFLKVGAKVKHEGFSMWKKCMENNKKAIKEMGTYCDGDIVVLRDVYMTIKNYIKHNTHVGAHNGGLKCSCPSCGSENIALFKNNFTASGTIKRQMECQDCNYSYETSNSAYRTFLEMNNNL